jgi:hypothetical protein
MEVRLKKSRELVGHTEEMKPGISRTLEAGPLQEGHELIEYELGVVIHPTRIKGQIYLGYALFADSVEHAQQLPGYKPYGSGAPEKVVVDSSRKKRNRAVNDARNRKAAAQAVANDPLA